MASEKQIVANKRNAAKSTGPRTQKGKARSRMNALRHGLSSVVIDVAAFDVQPTIPCPESVDTIVGGMQQRLHQIDVERVKILGKIEDFSKSPPSDEPHKLVRRLAALERYSRRSYSDLKKHFKSPK